MKPTNKYIILLSSLIVLLVSIFSCQRRDIEDLPTSSVFIKIDWKDNKAKTDFFYVLVYPRDSRLEVTKTFIESDGGYIQVPRGKFDIIIFSYDYEHIIVRQSNKFMGAYATTSVSDPDRAYKSTDYVDLKSLLILNSTDETFYTGVFENLEINDIGKDYKIEIAPKNVIKNYEIKIKVTNPDNIAKLYAIVSGFSGSYLMGSQTLANDLVAIHASMTLEDDFLVMPLNTFGKVRGSENIMTIKLILLSGEERYYNFNTTNAINNLPNGGIIIMDSIVDIPVISGSGGIGGTVGDWGDEDGVDIVM